MAHFSSSAGRAAPRRNRRITLVLASALNIGLCVGLLGLFGVLFPRDAQAHCFWSLKAGAGQDAGIFRQIPLFAGSIPEMWICFIQTPFPSGKALVSFASTLDEMKGIRMDDLRIHSGGASSSQSEEGSRHPSPRGGMRAPPAPLVWPDDGAEGEWKGDMFIYKGQALSAFGVGGNMSMADSYAGHQSTPTTPP